MENPSLSTPPAGSIRFNTDSAKIEIYNGEKWWEVASTSPEARTGSARGVSTAGNTPTYYNEIVYFNIDSTGNAADFGDMTRAHNNVNVVSSRTRGVCGGGYGPGNVEYNTIDYITIASLGNAADFGDLSEVKRNCTPISTETRGIFAGGYNEPAKYNTIEYITISATGNAVDFGDMTNALFVSGSSCSPTRGVITGGQSPNVNVIQYINQSSLGNAADFGDLISASTGAQGICSNAIRGLHWNQSNNSIEYITIASLGNATDFGDSTYVPGGGATCSSRNRGVVFGGYVNPSNINLMSYTQLMTTGNAQDFGDLARAWSSNGGGSNAHGGLG